MMRWEASHLLCDPFRKTKRFKQLLLLIKSIEREIDEKAHELFNKNSTEAKQDDMFLWQTSKNCYNFAGDFCLLHCIKQTLESD